MHVTVDIPDPKTSALDAALAKQFADIQRHLMRLVESKESSAQAMQETFLDALEEQQTTLVKAMERLMGMVSQFKPESGHAEPMMEALKGLKRTMADLPGDLKDALDHQYQQVQAKAMPSSSTPRVTVQMPQRLMERIDSLESALLTGLRRSRSRTFGSNY